MKTKHQATSENIEVVLTSKEIPLPQAGMLIPADTTIAVDRLKRVAYYMGYQFEILDSEYLILQ